MAADPDIHRPVPLDSLQSQKYGSDISFMGAGYYNRQKMLYGLMDFDLKIWGTGWDPRSPLRNLVQKNGERLSVDETVKIYNASRININLHSSVYHEGVNPDGDFINPRTFEVCSCGGFQLVDRRSLLSRHFIPGSELVCYGSLDELRKMIGYYLKRPEECRRIAESGRKRVLGEHTYRHRMVEMLEWIKERKPDCFMPKNAHMPAVYDIGSFCARHPEASHIFTEDLSGCSSADLDTIVNSIRSKSGELSEPEAMFLLMKEYYSLFTEERT
jgi:spore maturation protein CgeB